MAKYVTIIGRAEEIDIVGTALGIPAKVDTGAYRSSIHASDIKIVEKALAEKDPDLTVLIKFSKALEKSSVVLKKVIEEKGEIFIFLLSMLSAACFFRELAKVGRRKNFT